MLSSPATCFATYLAFYDHAVDTLIKLSYYIANVKHLDSCSACDCDCGCCFCYDNYDHLCCLACSHDRQHTQKYTYSKVLLSNTLPIRASQCDFREHLYTRSSSERELWPSSSKSVESFLKQGGEEANVNINQMFRVDLNRVKRTYVCAYCIH